MLWPLLSRWRPSFPLQNCKQSLSFETGVWRCGIPQVAVFFFSTFHLKNGFVWKCWVYSQWNSHLIGIIIINHWVKRGTQHFQTHPNVEKLEKKNLKFGYHSVAKPGFLIRHLENSSNFEPRSPPFCLSMWTGHYSGKRISLGRSLSILTDFDRFWHILSIFQCSFAAILTIFWWATAVEFVRRGTIHWSLIIELDDGKIYAGKPIKFDGKNHGFRLRFSLKPTHWSLIKIWYVQNTPLRTQPISQAHLAVHGNSAAKHCLLSVGITIAGQGRFTSQFSCSCVEKVGNGWRTEETDPKWLTYLRNFIMIGHLTTLSTKFPPLYLGCWEQPCLFFIWDFWSFHQFVTAHRRLPEPQSTHRWQVVVGLGARKGQPKVKWRLDKVHFWIPKNGDTQPPRSFFGGTRHGKLSHNIT